jgi:hypothetical protein
LFLCSIIIKCSNFSNINTFCSHFVCLFLVCCFVYKAKIYLSFESRMYCYNVN